MKKYINLILIVVLILFLISDIPQAKGASQLKSNFFKNDSQFVNIISGKTTIDINGYDGNVDSLQFKIVSALVQLGYIMENKWPQNEMALRILHRFQKDQGLSFTNIVDKNLLEKIDSLLAQQEINDANIAKNFPLYSEIAEGPLNWPSKNHILAVWQKVFSSLPSKLVSADFFRLFLNDQYLTLKNNSDKYPLVKNFYRTDYHHRYVPFNDYYRMATVLHEFAHQIDKHSKGEQGLIDTNDFYNIGWKNIGAKTHDKEGIGFYTYGEPKSAIRHSSPSNPAHVLSLYTDGVISGYGGANLREEDGVAHISNIHEDFAESFMAYILAGKIFKEKAKNNNFINQKYQWLKNNVFDGKEYTTGTPNYKSIDYSPTDNDPIFSKIVSNVAQYSLMDDDFIKWDGHTTTFTSMVPTPTPTPTPSPISGVTLIKASNDVKVYAIVDNKRHWIPTTEIFNSYSYDWNKISIISRTQINNYTRVKLLRAEGDPKVYYLTEKGYKRHIPSPEVFNSYGNKWENVITVSATEIGFYSDSGLIRLMGGTKVYKLENGKKRWIKTAEAFNRYGFNWNNIAPVNQTELNYYSMSSNIE